MSTRDIFQSISDLGSDAIQKIVDRLEYRGGDPTFVRMRETYLGRMGLEPNARVLDLGCGTGVVSRALAQREGFTGAVVGIDFSDALIDAARRLAGEKGLDDRIEFRVGDSHALEDPDDSYDVVIAHTLISHVVDPGAVISEASRAVRPDLDPLRRDSCRAGPSSCSSTEKGLLGAPESDPSAWTPSSGKPGAG